MLAASATISWNALVLGHTEVAWYRPISPQGRKRYYGPSSGAQTESLSEAVSGSVHEEKRGNGRRKAECLSHD